MKWWRFLLQVIAICVVIVGGGLWFDFGCYGDSDSAKVVFRSLEGYVPRTSISFAKRKGYRDAPTFLALVSTNGVTNWPTLFRDLGCVRAREKGDIQRVEGIVAFNFKNHLKAPTNVIGTGHEFWMGEFKRNSYFVSAIVSASNAFIVLDRKGGF